MNKYQVTINGQVHTRKSESRTYTHAIVGLRNIERDRARAYGWDKTDQKSAEQDFCHYQEYANIPDHSYSQGYQAKSQQIVALGLEGYIAQVKAKKIEEFEADVRKGRYTWMVTGWAGSQKLADSRVKTLTNRPWAPFSDVRAIPVGSEVVLPQ
jgi:hypothetical protein